MRRLFLAALIVAGFGCADNAILELRVQLPAATSTEPQYAFIILRSSADTDFDENWVTSQVDGFLLEGSAREVTISVVAQPEDFGSDLLARARFCSTARCEGFGDDTAGEHRLVVEEPFYSLRRTTAEWVLPGVATTVQEVPDRIDRCSVQGCRDGITSSYCRADDTHFCE